MSRKELDSLAPFIVRTTSLSETRIILEFFQKFDIKWKAGQETLSFGLDGTNHSINYNGNCLTRRVDHDKGFYYNEIKLDNLINKKIWI